MLRIGYLRPHDPQAERAAERAALTAAGCQVIRAEEPPGSGLDDFGVLHCILDFIGPGDELVVGRLERLGSGGRAMLDVLERLERHGAGLRVLDPGLSSLGPAGAALRAALEAVAAVDPAPRGLRRRPAQPHDIRALRRAGVGPVEIARRLGVSRMTVWRKLKAMEARGT
jgi:DNA invertase Pin-like site-specific DNA recombinase